VRWRRRRRKGDGDGGCAKIFLNSATHVDAVAGGPELRHLPQETANRIANKPKPPPFFSLHCILQATSCSVYCNCMFHDARCPLIFIYIFPGTYIGRARNHPKSIQMPINNLPLTTIFKMGCRAKYLTVDEAAAAQHRWTHTYNLGLRCAVPLSSI
jgi:hypothetical protein